MGFSDSKYGALGRLAGCEAGPGTRQAVQLDLGFRHLSSLISSTFLSHSASSFQNGDFTLGCWRNSGEQNRSSPAPQFLLPRGR
jgi:hypothetical protein